ncbi:hypothetical protein KQH49_00850 [Mycetohabitans sp. B5]|uniref:Uncharacterized protein n=2 Tax=Mycetohabitans endofungorum TaxID=417203 RepID=A0A2P5K8H0_9BURK|nr:hypothetical protein [Mycetohabitans sp. B5]MCG1053583.1 hypothetical protein [Mycetohabitans sp. B5]PPB83013.1 hypothetical protein B0O95_11173 [Mycetohabitans endofungorum]
MTFMQVTQTVADYTARTSFAVYASYTVMFTRRRMRMQRRMMITRRRATRCPATQASMNGRVPSKSVVAAI